jgi:putative DNA primase/helicase
MQEQELAKDWSYKGPGDEPVRYEISETGQAEWFRDHLPQELKYDHTTRKWYFFKPGLWWERDMGGKVGKLIMQAYRKRLSLATERIETDKELETIGKAYIDKLGSARAHGSVEKNARGLLGSARLTWDDKPYLLGVKNGVVDLERGDLHPGKAEDNVSQHTEIEFDPLAVCPRWEKFVGEIFGGDKDMIEFFQRAVGYTLTGETRENRWFLCYGLGSNGKSTALEYTLLPFFSDYGMIARIESFIGRSDSDKVPADIAEMEGKRYVLTSEPSNWTTLNDGRLKLLVSGGKLRCRRLYEQEKEYKAVLKFWITSNHMPIINDDTEGFWRRILLIPFLINFDPNGEPTLESTLRGEAKGILAWAVRGAVKWYEDGLRVPKTVSEATSIYRVLSQSSGDFFERVVRDGAARTPKTEMFKAYLRFTRAADGDDARPLSKQKFNLKMAETFPGAAVKVKGTLVWRGIRPPKEKEDSIDV